MEAEEQDIWTSSEPKRESLAFSARDISFRCIHCAGNLVVDRDGEGLEVPCAHCERIVVVPPFEAPAAAARHRFDFTGFSREQLGRRAEELRHQLRENRSQDTELRGHVNRATMELHRLQLKLSALQHRQADIEAELGAARTYLQNNVMRSEATNGADYSQ